MKAKLFNELLESVREAGAVMRGERKAHRETKLTVLDGKAHSQQPGGLPEGSQGLRSAERDDTPGSKQPPSRPRRGRRTGLTEGSGTPSGPLQAADGENKQTLRSQKNRVTEAIRERLSKFDGS